MILKLDEQQSDLLKMLDIEELKKTSEITFEDGYATIEVTKENFRKFQSSLESEVTLTAFGPDCEPTEIGQEICKLQMYMITNFE